MADKDITVYHDGACPLCRLEIEHYRRQDGADAITFVDVSTPAADTGSGLTRGAAMSRFHVRTSDGRLRSGAGAFVEVWKRLPRWRWAARIAQWPGMLAVLEVGYRVSLPVRPFLARIAHRYG